MDSIQKQNEQVVGDKFINWYNKHINASFRYYSRGFEAPDLVYCDGNNEIYLEVTGAYYNQLDAAIRWQNARRKENAPKSWRGVNCDDSLIEHINIRLEEKCKKSYGKNCILVIYVRPYITSIEELADRLSEIQIPERNPFLKIYLTGDFPDSTKSKGGYQCWEISKSIRKTQRIIPAGIAGGNAAELENIVQERE